MTRDETLEAIKVMQHYADGGVVELRQRNWPSSVPWQILDASDTNWNWAVYRYRIRRAPREFKIVIERATGDVFAAREPYDSASLGAAFEAIRVREVMDE